MFGGTKNSTNPPSCLLKFSQSDGSKAKNMELVAGKNLDHRRGQASGGEGRLVDDHAGMLIRISSGVRQASRIAAVR